MSLLELAFDVLFVLLLFTFAPSVVLYTNIGMEGDQVGDVSDCVTFISELQLLVLLFFETLFLPPTKTLSLKEK